MAHFIIGASGSGKTAGLENLKKQLSDYTIADFDDIGVPDDADTAWRQNATETWIERIAASGLPSQYCLLGQMVPGEIFASPAIKKLDNVNIILLDCSDDVRVGRLKHRNTYGLNQDTLNWAAWLRAHSHDPQWEQHVIKENCSPVMQFDHWDELDSWKGVATIQRFDNSFLSIEETSTILANQITASRSDNQLHFAMAVDADLAAIVQLLADDTLGSTREVYTTPLKKSYEIAFSRIQQDPNTHLVTAKRNGELIGIAQLNFLANLTYQGGIRAQIEGVRVHKAFRNQGIGKQFFQHLISLAKHHSCHLVQLTTDKKRDGAQGFYKSLGFVDSHEGFKLHFTDKK